MSKRNFQLKFKDVRRGEMLFVVMVLVLIALFSYFNFQTSFVRSRDVQRKNDLKHISAALNNYFYDFGYYPKSLNDMILACGTSNNLRTCEWGQDAIRDLDDPSYPAYIDSLPKDPGAGVLRTYIYISNTRNFQLFASLENSSDDEYNGKVVKRNISCGRKVCNFGISSFGKPEDELPIASKTTAQ